MVDTNELRGIIAKNRKTQTDVAKMLHMTPKTFYDRMKKGVFGSDEIEIMIDELHIENPIEIFFAKEVTYKDTLRIKLDRKMVQEKKEPQRKA